jgi:PKD repeat protein
MGDIVLEYTYLLLDDTTNDPTHGSAQLTKMIFPMAGSQALDIPDKDTSDPIGLDSYDVNADGNDDIMSLEYISETLEAVVFSPQPRVGGEITLNEDEPRLEFLDFMVELEGTASQQQKADLNIYYTGTGKDAPMLVDQVTLWQGGGPVPALQGDTAALIGFRGLDDFSTGVVSTTVWTEGDFGFNGLAEPVCRPFIVYIDYVGDGEATVEVFRWLQEGETFFVDGAEYDVSKIHLVYDQIDGRPELKYFTLRNPIPKGEGDLTITQLTIKKRRVAAGENLPLLPPFDREHDMVDDVNIPDTYDGVDEQYLDNDPDEDEDCADEYPPDSGLYWGCDSGIHELFNTIKERVLTDVEQLDVYWLSEEKEERFDTNLLEAKFTEINLNETWWWINIESLPWDYTEFVLPSLPDIAADYEDIDDRWKSGDYLLVSSLLTEDSEGVDHGDGAVRMKFAYDPEEGTGIYVNAAGEPCDPVTITSLTSDSPVGLGETMSFTVTVTGTGPFTYEWDFGGDGTASDEETANPTYVYDEEGTYTVVVTATNPCGEATDDLEVEVVECDPVEIDSVTSDSPVTEGSAMHFLATVTGTGPFAYEWDFGGAGTPSNASTASPTYVYDAEGQYTVVLTATNPCGVDTYELDVEVEECVAVQIVSLVSDSPVMVGSKMHFTATVTGSEPSYTWDFGGDGSGTDLDTATPTFEYDSAGNYTVSLTVENPCSDDEETLPVEVTEMELYLPIILLNHPPCYEAVTNGGFELDTGWTIPATAYLAAYSTAEAHSGSRSMRVGIEESADNVYSYSSARQTVTIPADAASATLRFYTFPFSGETWAAGAFAFPPRGLTVREAGGFFGDMQYVYILDESDQQLGDALILERSDSREWTAYEFDLAQAPYLGQTVKLAFGAYNDGCCGVTGMYVDDVSLEICYESP